MDKLRLNKLQFHGYHGCHQVEQDKGQTFEVDIELEGDLTEAIHSDDLRQTFDFDAICQIAHDTVTGTRFNLIESLAEELCRRILERCPKAVVRLVVRKPKPPVSWSIESFEVEMTRGPLLKTE